MARDLGCYFLVILYLNYSFLKLLKSKLLNTDSKVDGILVLPYAKDYV